MMSSPGISEQDIQETMRAIYDSLESNVPKSFDDYPTKRKKLAKAIHDIQELMDLGAWPYWSSWDRWNTEKYFIHCFVCGNPVKVRAQCSLSRKLKIIDCPVCELVHFDSRYD